MGHLDKSFHVKVTGLTALLQCRQESLLYNFAPYLEPYFHLVYIQYLLDCL